MSLWLFPALVLPWITGACLIRATGMRLHAWGRHALGLVLGLGIGSLIFMLRPPLFSASRFALFSTELLVAIAACVTAHRCRPRPPVKTSGTGVRHVGGAVRMVIVALASLVVGLALLKLLGLCLRKPDGWFDAWGLWNYKARFLFHGGVEHWGRFLTDIRDWSHPDYPLFLPASVARMWVYLGAESVVGPIALVMALTAATLALMAGLLADKGPLFAGLAVAVLASSHHFLMVASYQCADLPLAFCLLATLGLMARAGRVGGGAAEALLIGAMAGLGAWTKNEGQVVALWCLLAMAGLALTRRAFTWRQVGLAALAATPMIAAALLVKLNANLGNDLFVGQKQAWLRQCLTDPERYRLIGQFITGLARRTFDPWRLSALLALILLCGFTADRRQRGMAALGAGLVLLIALTYALAYLVSPHDLTWHISTSLDRLWAQLLPATVFLLFLPLRQAGATRAAVAAPAGPAVGEPHGQQAAPDC